MRTIGESPAGRPEEPPAGARRARSPKRRAGLAALLLAAAFAVGVADASAVIVHVGGQTLSYQPVGAASVQANGSSRKPLEYHGGPVMPSNTNYALYWDPSGGPEYEAGYQSGLNRYFEDVAADSGGMQNTDSVLAQYGDGAGEFANYNSHFGGALIDTKPYPANGCPAAPICLTDQQLRAEITSYVEANKLPTDLQHEYFLLTPRTVESCLEAVGHACSAGTKHAAYCAYHSYIPIAKGVIVYANDPYVNGLNCDTGEEHPNGNPSDATIGGGLAEEHSESVTDPELNAWFDQKKLEAFDKCRTFNPATEFGAPLGKAPNGANYNQVIHGDLYWYPQAWSNNAGQCVQRAAAPPTVKKVSPKGGSQAGGTSVTITGTNFANPATVKFGAAFAKEVKVNSATSITAVSPAATPGIVDVTVTTAAGTSAITKKDHFKYKSK
jgi:hypothetical protein